MADTINIPSPSAFLRKSTPPPQAPPPSRPLNSPVKRKPKRVPSRKTSTVVHNTQKPKQSKSRNGCITCKAKRLKCDEEKPGCQQCAKRKVECGGYKKDFKWRPFEETNVKLNIDRQRKVTPPQNAPPESPTVPTPTSESRLPAPLPPSKGASTKNNITDKPDNSPSESQDRVQLPQRPAPRKSQRRDSWTASSRPESPPSISPRAATPPKESSPHVSTPANTDRVSTPWFDLDDFQNIESGTIGSISLSGPSPTFTELQLSLTDEIDLIPFGISDDPSFALPETPLLEPLTPNLAPDLGEDGDVDEVVQNGRSADEVQQIWASRYQSHSEQPLPLSPMRSLHVWGGPMNYMYTHPDFSHDSPEMLALRYDKLTCGILSIMDGPTENPWRSLIWPMTQQSPALYHAITAMTAFHSASDVPSLRLVGHEHKQASIRFIQEGIRDNSMTYQTAIATALALGFSESWDQHTASGNTHIKGAQALVKRALAEHQAHPLQDVELARLKFLCNAWVYMDVIARLTAVDSDNSNDFDNTFLFSPDAPQTVMGEAPGPPGFGIDFGMPVDARLDPLMGCAGSLFPLVGRVANLARKVCRSKSNSPSIISQANDLKLLLETWEPPDFIEPPEDPTSQVQHSLQTAEAYRWAALTHLHQSVPELPSPPTAELAQKALTYLATVPLASRTVIVHIFPLMVAGCEASTSEDRQWVSDRWDAMGVRMRIGVIDKCATVTEELWRRRDAYEAQPTTQRTLVATADLQSSRQRGGKLKRPHTDVRESSPGRSGVVFSWVDGEDDDAVGKARDRDEKRPWPKRYSPRSAIGSMDPAYTVRGHLHWIGVMWDWGWEVLLG